MGKKAEKQPEKQPRVLPKKSKRAENAAEVVKLREKGLSGAEIAEKVGVAPTTVWRILERTKKDTLNIKEFRSVRGDALSALQAKAMTVLDRLLECSEEDVSTLTTQQRLTLVQNIATTTSILFDKERLERGQSTTNAQNLLIIAQKRSMEDYKRNLCGGKLPWGEKKKLEAGEDEQHEG